MYSTGIQLNLLNKFIVLTIHKRHNEKIRSAYQFHVNMNIKTNDNNLLSARLSGTAETILYAQRISFITVQSAYSKTVISHDKTDDGRHFVTVLPNQNRSFNLNYIIFSYGIQFR